MMVNYIVPLAYSSLTSFFGLPKLICLTHHTQFGVLKILLLPSRISFCIYRTRYLSLYGGKYNVGILDLL